MTAGLSGMGLALAAAAFAASAGLSQLARRFALAYALLDVPNERSLHSVPTPRGGGLAIVLVVLAGVGVLLVSDWVGVRLAIALGGGGVMVAAAGWLDDRRGVPAKWRLLTHVAAASWAVAWLEGMPDLSIGTSSVELAGAGAALAILGVVWATNLYNFMDGIDGLAGAEAVAVGLAGALLLGSHGSSLAAVALLVAAASGGFLVWNWPPARIFMGDVGSGFLGFFFGVLAMATENEKSMPALLWILLLSPFVTDATITLVRRIVRGERWYAAHRSHAYQRAVQAGWSHCWVSVTIVSFSAALGVLGLMVVRSPSLLLPALVGAFLGSGVLYLIVERSHPMPDFEKA